MKKILVYKIALGITLVGLVVWFVLLTHNADKQYTANLVSVANNTGNDDIEMTINTPSGKKWSEGSGYGAQYDFYIFNNSTSDLKNWVLTIDIPEGSQITSSWDAVFTVYDNELHITPGTGNTTMTSGTITSFGLVLITPTDKAFVMETGSITGDYKLSLSQSTSFRIFIVVLIVWLFCAAYFFGFTLLNRFYEKQQSRDKEIIVQSIMTFANFIDAKDPYTNGHSSRVAAYSRELARRMKFSERELESIYYIALMHDVGKIAIPDAILNKNGALTPAERNIIQSHTTKGGEMLKSFTSLDGIMEGALYHHERYDGMGYPHGLSGENIPLYARIICVADSYDAMSSNRCYRKHLTRDVILSELDKNAGTQFDPNIVRHMIDMINEGFTDTIKGDDE